MNSRKKWAALPEGAPEFALEDEDLHKQWSRLHRGDCEPYPTPDALHERLARERGVPSALDAAAHVRDAWRAFHRGDFQGAFDAGTRLGLPGFAAALKAAGVYASYLERNEQRAQELLQEAVERADEIVERLPKDPNAHYLLAFCLGRYSQRISVLEALTRGYAGRIERSLQQALKLQPKHADAHLAMGVYHAEIVGKLGSLAAGLTYGASAAKSIDHFKKAMKLNPDAPVTALEYAQGLRALNEKEHRSEIHKLLERAAGCTAVDAMEWLYAERARALLR